MNKPNGRAIGGAGTGSACLAGILFILTSGCGGHQDVPSAPSAPPDVSADHVVGPIATEPAQRPETVNLEKNGQVLTTTAVITRAYGGTLQAGRVKLTIPPGALAKDTQITLKDISSQAGYVACEALPEGLEFVKPVRLEMSFGDLKSPAGFTVYWVAEPDSDDERWVDMWGRPTNDGTGVLALLTHFSTYAPGKAGWSPRAARPGRGQFESGGR